MTVPSVSSKHELRNAGGGLVSGVNAALAAVTPPNVVNKAAPNIQIVFAL
ncbi:MAG TPA: hypothetical protein VHO06_20880 [Polyangia bacterium]|nr:hypothetical protein [Polyangia bacterium]